MGQKLSWPRFWCPRLLHLWLLLPFFLFLFTKLFIYYFIITFYFCSYFFPSRKIHESLLRQFVIFKPISYCFKETMGFDVKASFASHPVSHLIGWYNKPGDITEEFWKKVYSIPQDFSWIENYKLKKIWAYCHICAYFS